MTDLHDADMTRYADLLDIAHDLHTRGFALDAEQIEEVFKLDATMNDDDYCRKQVETIMGDLPNDEGSRRVLTAIIDKFLWSKKEQARLLVEAVKKYAAKKADRRITIEDVLQEAIKKGVVKA